MHALIDLAVDLVFAVAILLLVNNGAAMAARWGW